MASSGNARMGAVILDCWAAVRAFAYLPAGEQGACWLISVVSLPLTALLVMSADLLSLLQMQLTVARG